MATPARGDLDLVTRTVAFIIFLVPMYFLVTEGVFGGRTDFLVVSGLFSVYTCVEMYLFGRRRPREWLMSPPVLATLFVFLLGYGLTNFLYLIPGFEYSALRNMVAGEDAWLGLAVIYAMIGVFAMWLGFGLPVGEMAGDKLKRGLLNYGILRSHFEPRWVLVAVLVVASLVARLIQVRLGFYGVLAAAQHADPPAYSQYLTTIRQLGLVALLVSSMAAFSKDPMPFRYRVLVIGLALHECAWGFLAADKGMTVIPIIMVGVCFYAMRGKIPTSWVMGAFAALAVGFLIIQPLRKVEFDQQGVDIGAVAGAASGIVSEQLATDTEGVGIDLGTTASERLNNTGRTALGIWFRDEGAQGREPPANLLMLLVTSPVAALVPRALWPGKPSGNEVGSWLYYEVLGGSSDVATKFGVGPVGYLYMAGGVLVILFGFACLGIAQRLIWTAFFRRHAGGLLVFLGLIPTVVLLRTTFYTIFIDGIRMMIVLLIIQFIIFRKEPPGRLRRQGRPPPSNPQYSYR